MGESNGAAEGHTERWARMSAYSHKEKLARCQRMARSGLFYIRFMDDILVLASTRWRLRKAVNEVNEVLGCRTALAPILISFSRSVFRPPRAATMSAWGYYNYYNYRISIYLFSKAWSSR